MYSEKIAVTDYAYTLVENLKGKNMYLHGAIFKTFRARCHKPEKLFTLIFGF